MTPTKTERKRQARVRHLLRDALPTDKDMHDALLNDEHPFRYLMVETSRHDGSVFVTNWHDRDAAAEHWAAQEYPEDWGQVELYDLDTGERFYGALSVKWESHPDGHPDLADIDAEED